MPPVICDACGEPQTTLSSAVIYTPAGPPESPRMIRRVICSGCSNAVRIAKAGGAHKLPVVKARPSRPHPNDVARVTGWCERRGR